MIISAEKTGCSLAKLINGALKTDKSVILESGIYELDGTIYMPDDSSLVLRDGAILKAQDHAFDKAGCVSVITNSDKQNGNRNIKISGGVFDGNNAFNHRENWKTGPCRGLLFDFINVDGLKLQNLTAKNSESYHFRLGFVCNFVIENVTVSDDLFTPCQDGIHVGGGCQNGVIRNIFAEKGSTNDDLVAFNADDVNYYRHARRRYKQYAGRKRNGGGLLDRAEVAVGESSYRKRHRGWFYRRNQGDGNKLRRVQVCHRPAFFGRKLSVGRRTFEKHNA